MNRETQNELALLLADHVVKQGDIYYADIKKDRTVWDVLADENPTHAAISAADEETAERKSSNQIEHLKENLEEGVTLDLGCGYGRIAQYLLPKRSFKGYVGLDSSKEMLALFSKRYQKNSKEQTTPLLLVCSDISKVPLKDDTVENVVVSAVFLHNHKSITHTSLSEVRRILKPGGRILVYSSFPNLMTLMGLQGALYLWYLNMRNQAFKNGPIRYYTRSEVKNLMHGFSLLEVNSVGFTVLPKRILFLRGKLDILYRNHIANPCNRFLAQLCPKNLKQFFATHHDVIATL